MSTVA